VHKVKPETLQSILRLADSVSATKSDIPGDLKYDASAEGGSTSSSPLPSTVYSSEPRSELPFGVSTTDDTSKITAGSGQRVGFGHNEILKLAINEGQLRRCAFMTYVNVKCWLQQLSRTK